MERYAYILAGGRSSRFGSNKALVQFDGQLHLLRLADALRSDGWSVTVVARTLDSYADLSLPVIADHEPDQGPVAGALASLHDLRLHVLAQDRFEESLPYALLLPCDLWNWNPRWTEGFLKATSDSLEDNYPKAVQLQIASMRGTTQVRRGEGFTPFPCWLHVDLYRVVQDSWDAGDRSLRGVFARFESQVAWVPIQGNDEAMIPRSFNTVEDLRRLRGEEGDVG